MTEQNDRMDNGGSQQAAPQPQVMIQPLRSSESLDALAGALAKAQGAMKHPGKNKTAKVPLKTGGSYQYNYADLADCIDAIRGPLAANGLALVQMAFNEPGAVGIVTRILHASGQWIEGTLFMPCADSKPQSIGSAITYGRRYALSPMAGIASDDDDDGSAAQGLAAETTRRPGRGSSAPAAEPHYEPVDGASRPNVLPPKTAKMLGAFTELGVTREQIEAHCGGASLDGFGDADLEALKFLYADIKAGTVKAADVGRKKDTKSALNDRFKK